jgi:hypothetical protein
MGDTPTSIYVVVYPPNPTWACIFVQDTQRVHWLLLGHNWKKNSIACCPMYVYALNNHASTQQKLNTQQCMFYFTFISRAFL